MYDFIIRLRPEFEATRAQIHHIPSAHTLAEAFAIVRSEETRIRASLHGEATALASRFPVASSPLPSSSASSRTSRSRPPLICRYCGILGHHERQCRKKQRGLPRQPPHGMSRSTATSAPLLPTPTPPISPADHQELLTLLRQLQQTHIADSSTGHARSAQEAPSTPGSSWILDSGASFHMTRNDTHLHHTCPPSLATHVRIANGSLLCLLHRSSIL